MNQKQQEQKFVSQLKQQYQRIINIGTSTGVYPRKPRTGKTITLKQLAPFRHTIASLTPNTIDVIKAEIEKWNIQSVFMSEISMSLCDVKLTSEAELESLLDIISQFHLKYEDFIPAFGEVVTRCFQESFQEYNKQYSAYLQSYSKIYKEREEKLKTEATSFDESFWNIQVPGSQGLDKKYQRMRWFFILVLHSFMRGAVRDFKVLRTCLNDLLTSDKQPEFVYHTVICDFLDATYHNLLDKPIQPLPLLSDVFRKEQEALFAPPLEFTSKASLNEAVVQFLKPPEKAWLSKALSEYVEKMKTFFDRLHKVFLNTEKKYHLNLNSRGFTYINAENEMVKVSYFHNECLQKFQKVMAAYHEPFPELEQNVFVDEVKGLIVKVDQGSAWEDTDTVTFYADLFPVEKIPKLLLNRMGYRNLANNEVANEEKQEEKDAKKEDGNSSSESEEENEDEDENEEENQASIDSLGKHLDMIERLNSKELANKLIESFCYRYTRKAKKRLREALLNVTTSCVDALPYYAYIVSSISQIMPMFGKTIEKSLRESFFEHFGSSSTLHFATGEYLCELVKFGQIPPRRYFEIIGRGFEYFSGTYNPKNSRGNAVVATPHKSAQLESLCCVLKGAGRKFFYDPNYNSQMRIILNRMKNFAENISLDYVKHLIQETIEGIEEENSDGSNLIFKPQEESYDEVQLFLRILLHKILDKPKQGQVFKTLLCFDWKKYKEFIVYTLYGILFEKNSSELEVIVEIIGLLSRYKPFVLVQIIDRLFEEFYDGLKYNSPYDRQRRLQQIFIFAELFNYRLIEDDFFFTLLKFIILSGHQQNDPKSFFIDPPSDLIRVRMLVSLLSLISTFPPKTKELLTLFQYYVAMKQNIGKELSSLFTTQCRRIAPNFIRYYTKADCEAALKNPSLSFVSTQFQTLTRSKLTAVRQKSEKEIELEVEETQKNIDEKHAKMLHEKMLSEQIEIEKQNQIRRNEEIAKRRKIREEKTILQNKYQNKLLEMIENGKGDEYIDDDEFEDASNSQIEVDIENDIKELLKDEDHRPVLSKPLLIPTAITDEAEKLHSSNTNTFMLVTRIGNKTKASTVVIPNK